MASQLDVKPPVKSILITCPLSNVNGIRYITYRWTIRTQECLLEENPICGLQIASQHPLLPTPRKLVQKLLELN